jgi:peptidoglycan hydrolase-like protein with peptidoglycan-binding domain
MVTKKIVNGLVIGNVLLSIVGVSYASATDTTVLPVSIQAISADITSTSLPSISSNLSLGSVGIDVTTLQTSLEKAGYLTMPKGVAKGYFGLATKEALKKFQKANGLNASGYFGPLTKNVYLTKGMGVASVANSNGVTTSGATFAPQQGNGNQPAQNPSQVPQINHPLIIGSTTGQMPPLSQNPNTMPVPTTVDLMGGTTSTPLPPQGKGIPNMPASTTFSQIVPPQQSSTSSQLVLPVPAMPPKMIPQVPASTTLIAPLPIKVIPISGVPTPVVVPIVKPVPITPQPIVLPVIKPVTNGSQPVSPMSAPALPPKKI